MGLISFQEFSKNLGNKKKENVKIEEKKTSFKKLKHEHVSLPVRDLPKREISKKVNESAFEVGEDFKVKSVFDVPKDLVTNYIEKVKEETGKDPLDNFNESEIAEQLISYIVKQNLVIDNLPSNITVGDENGETSTTEDVLDSDASNLSSDMGDEEDFEEIEFEDDDDNASDEIELYTDVEDVELGEDIEIEDSEEESEDDSFEEIEFEDEDDDTESEDENKTKKTVGEYKKEKGAKSEEDNEEEEEVYEDEEVTLEDLFKEIGYKTGYSSTLANKNLFK